MSRVAKDLREDHFGPTMLGIPGACLPEADLRRLRGLLEAVGRLGWYRSALANDPLLEMADQWARLRLTMHRRPLTPALVRALERVPGSELHAMPLYLLRAMHAWRKHMALHFDRGLVVKMVNAAAVGRVVVRMLTAGPPEQAVKGIDYTETKLPAEKVTTHGALGTVAEQLDLSVAKVRALYYDEN